MARGITRKYSTLTNGKSLKNFINVGKGIELSIVDKSIPKCGNPVVSGHITPIGNIKTTGKLFCPLHGDYCENCCKVSSLH
jgi:hypothetical protein